MFSTSCYLLWENFTGSYLVTEKYEKMVNKTINLRFSLEN